MVIKTLESGTGTCSYLKKITLSLLNMSAGCWRSLEDPQSTEEAEESAYMRTCEKKLIDQLDPLVYYGISPCEQSSGN
jgi:hypothetical protein